MMKLRPRKGARTGMLLEIDGQPELVIDETVNGVRISPAPGNKMNLDAVCDSWILIRTRDRE